MVAKNELSTALQEIDAKLKELPDATDCVRVIPNELGHVHAFVGSSRFDRLGPAERQESVWEYLRIKVNPDSLRLLYRVEPMTVDEFVTFIRQVQMQALSSDTTSNSLDLFTSGYGRDEDGDD